MLRNPRQTRAQQQEIMSRLTLEQYCDYQENLRSMIQESKELVEMYKQLKANPDVPASLIREVVKAERRLRRYYTKVV